MSEPVRGSLPILRPFGGRRRHFQQLLWLYEELICRLCISNVLQYFQNRKNSPYHLPPQCRPLLLSCQNIVFFEPLEVVGTRNVTGSHCCAWAQSCWLLDYGALTNEY